MAESIQHTVSRLLQSAAGGEPLAAEALVPLVYDELRRLARAQLRSSGPQTLQATALVNEVFMRLVGKDAGFASREHFFFAAARAMRDIVVEQARRREALKRGGNLKKEELDEAAVVIEDEGEDVLSLHEALSVLEAQSPERARVVMLRYFAGLSMPEVSAALGLPLRTVERQWRFARAWLWERMNGAPRLES